MLRPGGSLAKAKALSSLVQRQHEAVPQQLLALILDQIQLVEARVRGGQLVLRPIRPVDLKLLRPTNALHPRSKTSAQAKVATCAAAGHQETAIPCVTWPIPALVLAPLLAAMHTS